MTEIPNEEEQMEFLDRLYGKDLPQRFFKLSEEYKELMEAAEAIETVPPSKAERAAIIDELSDVAILVQHITHLLGETHKGLIDRAYLKIKGRQKDPNFQREHPHKEMLCHDCKFFKDGWICTKTFYTTTGDKCACLRFKRKKIK